MEPPLSESRTRILTPRYLMEYQGSYVSIRPGYEPADTADDNWWTLLAEICTANDCYRVLSDTDLCPPASSFSETFDSAAKAAAVLSQVKLAIYFGENLPSESQIFFQTVARNRGLVVELFSQREEALCWLNAMD